MHMTDDPTSFLDTIHKIPVLVVYFSYPTCNVCRVLRPKVEEMLQYYPEIDFLYIDIHRNPVIAGQHLVFAAPTIIIFLSGKEMKRLSRFISITELQNYLDIARKNRA